VTSKEGSDELTVAVEKAPGVKCERCWRFVPSVRSESDSAGLCDRCVDALAEPVNG
jgi:isoleucyl-tRNA synthetase